MHDELTEDTYWNDRRVFAYTHVVYYVNSVQQNYNLQRNDLEIP